MLRGHASLMHEDSLRKASCRTPDAKQLIGHLLHMLLLLLLPPPCPTHVQLLQHAVPHRLPQDAVAASNAQHGDYGASPTWPRPLVGCVTAVISAFNHMCYN
jgi:hypothetical protein